MRALVARLSALLAMAFAPAIRAEVFDGTAVSVSSWSFITRYCFSSDAKVSFSLTLHPDSSAQLLLYSEEMWDDVYKSAYSCATRIRMASYKRDYTSGNLTAEETFNGEIDLVGVSEPKWFFVALSNCETDIVSNGYAQASLDVKYSLTLMNGNEHSSVNDEGLPEQEIVFLVFQTLLGIFAFNTFTQLQSLNKMPHTVKLLGASIFLHLIGVLLLFIAYQALAGSGKRNHKLFIAGRIFSGLAEMCMLLLLILLAKGWTIVRAKISARGRVKIAVFMTTYVVAYWVAFTWAEVGVNRAEVMLTMGSAPGVAVLVLRVLATLWLVHASHTTTSSYYSAIPPLYARMVIASCAWTMSLPFLFLVSLPTPGHRRQSLLNAGQLTTFFAVQAQLLYLYQPDSSFAKLFAFSGKAPVAAVGRPGHTGSLQFASTAAGTGSTASINSNGSLRRRRVNPRAHGTQALIRLQQRMALLQSYAEDLEQALEEVGDLEDHKLDDSAAGSREGTPPPLIAHLDKEGVVASSSGRLVP